LIKQEKVMGCPECGNSDLIRDYEAGELVCERCGMVISSTLFDHGPEWRAFDEEQREKRTRVGAPLTWTIHDKGLSTIIDWHDRDVYGRKLKPMQKARVYRLRKWHRRSKVSGATERNLAFALSELTKVETPDPRPIYTGRRRRLHLHGVPPVQRHPHPRGGGEGGPYLEEGGGQELPVPPQEAGD
jgi:hypothetical protein